MEPIFVEQNELSWKGILKGMPKASNQLQPLYECLTNSIEAIDMRDKRGDSFNPEISIVFRYNATVDSENGELIDITIKDNGIGFDEAGYRRLVCYKDDSKNYNNRGSGRIQLIHFFQHARYNSIYQTSNNTKAYRIFSLSNRYIDLGHNAIIKIEEQGEANGDAKLSTSVVLETLNDSRDAKFYGSLRLDTLKQEIINHYLFYFCTHLDSFPNITLKQIIQNELSASLTITKEDIPSPSKEDVPIAVNLSKISDDFKRVEQMSETCSISLRSYKLPANQLQKNEVKITCKGEISDSVKIKLSVLSDDATIDNCRFLVLLSSPYFDERVNDARDHFELLDKHDFKKIAKSCGQIAPQIVLEDLEAKVNEAAINLYAEIQKCQEEHLSLIDKLRETYCLSDDAIAEVQANDNVENILQRAYEYDAKVVAKRDAEYYNIKQQLDTLDTRLDTYQDDLAELVTKLNSLIPLKDKASLSRYVAHRKLSIELFDKILQRQLQCQKQAKRVEDEKLIHDFLFRQKTNGGYGGDLWMLNEESIYFQGCSDIPFKDICVSGKKLFKNEFEEQEREYLSSLGENRLLKRPDILLFPSEGKCIIIELKTPSENLSDHLSQIQKYAYFLRNFTNDDFQIKLFYGYLIGENITERDVHAADSDFKYDSCFQYYFRPAKTILDDSDRHQNGDLYTEILQYSVLLERAKARNKVYFDNLLPDMPELPEKDAPRAMMDDVQQQDQLQLQFGG